jgi:META domain
MQQGSRLASFIAIATLGGCTGVQSPTPLPTTVPPPDHATLANARYVGVQTRPIELHNGEFDAASAGAASRDEIRLFDTTTLGDIDDNGVAETAALLRRSGGGSGSFVYLAIADRDNLGAIPVQLIGDRVQIRALSASPGEVHADVVRAGQDDAACCPGETVRLTWHYADGKLSTAHEGQARRVGVGDLAGTWRLAFLDEVPTRADVTLHIDDSRFGGQAVCNSYSGELALGRHPGQLHIGPIATTSMTCTDDNDTSLEHAYLNALSRAQTFRFAPAQLIFGYFTTADASGAPHALIFVRDDSTH